MVRRFLLTAVWLSFVGYAFFLAPPNQPDTAALIQQLATGDWQGINPIVVALFNLMGIWPLAYAALAIVDGAHQKVPAWPFVLGSFGFGAFLLMPYLVLRQPNSAPPENRSKLIGWLESRGWGISLLIGTVALLGYGFYAGDWSDFFAQWQSSRFIHVMSLDFCLLWLLVPSLLGDDMTRRGLKSRQLFALVSIVPALGLTAYLAFRPRLPEV